MTEHSNNEAAQAIIKLAYQQMQAMPQNQQVQQQQQPQPAAPAPKTLGDRAATAFRVGSAIERGTAKMRKDQAKAKARRVFAKEFKKGKGKNIVSRVIGAKFKSYKAGKKADKGGVVSQAGEALLGGVDKAISATKDRTAEAIRKHGSTGATLYVAGKGIEGMKKKKSRTERALDFGSGVYDRVTKEKKKASKERKAARKQIEANREPGAQRPTLAVTRKLHQTAAGKGSGSAVRGLAGHLGTKGLSAAMVPGGKQRTARERVGRGLQEAGKGYAASKETADKLRKMIDG